MGLANAVLTAAQKAAGATAVVGADSSGVMIMPSGESIGGGAPARAVGYELEQPAKITSPVKKFGKLAARFGSGQWVLNGGTPILTQGYTGWDGAGNKTGLTSRTGMPDMLKAVSAANTSEEIRLNDINNMLTRTLGGKIGIWMYLESQPGYQVAGTVTGAINIDISTTTAGTNAVWIGWNVNQLRDGWNFVKFVMRNPAAYVVGSGATEDHPFGVSCTSFGTGVDTDLVGGTIGRLRINWSNMSGATLYFDSIWTDFDATPQIVWGNDGGTNLTQLALPLFNSYGWVGYAALPYSTTDSGTSANTVQSNLGSAVLTNFTALYDAGWELINHTVTHPSVGSYTSEAAIATQMDQAKAWLIEAGFVRGCEFYASPQSNTSRLSEKVIKSLGYKIQRHSRKWNVTVTPFGVDNTQHIGAIDIGSAGTGSGITRVTGGVSASLTGWQTASKIKRAIDITVAYGDTLWPFWHGITQVGDTGTGEDATGDNLLLTYSAFASVCAYVRGLEQAGTLKVCRGISEFYYG